MGLRYPFKFSPVARELAIHTQGRYVMDVDQVVVNFARGFVLHMECKTWDERPIDPKQMATIQMIADVWNRCDGIFRDYDDGFHTHRHCLTYRGFYIFKAGTSDAIEDDDPWQLLVLRKREVLEFEGESGARQVIHDIARGAI
jgi:hypothetical protein